MESRESEESDGRDDARLGHSWEIAVAVVLVVLLLGVALVVLWAVKRRRRQRQERQDLEATRQSRAARREKSRSSVHTNYDRPTDGSSSREVLTKPSPAVTIEKPSRH